VVKSVPEGTFSGVRTIVGTSGRPIANLIANRPQVANLPHELSGECVYSDFKERAAGAPSQGRPKSNANRSNRLWHQYAPLKWTRMLCVGLSGVASTKTLFIYL
jgi:hypothetical protein